MLDVEFLGTCEQFLPPSIHYVCPHTTAHAMQHQREEVTRADRVPSPGGDSMAVPSPVPHPNVAALAMGFSVVALNSGEETLPKGSPEDT